MKRLIVITLLIAVPSTVLAIKPRRSPPYDAPTTVPASIGTVYYITGLPKIDTHKYEEKSRGKYKGRFDFGKKDVTFKRTRMRQDGRRGLEDVDIVRFKYSNVTDLYYGHDAIQKAVAGLPTGSKNIYDGTRSALFGVPHYTPLPEFMKHRYMPPVIIFFKRGKETISLVVRGAPARMKALYNLLAKQARLKVKPPTKYP